VWIVSCVGFNYANQMDSLLWLEEEKSDCKGKWIDENLFPVGEKTKGTCNFRFYIFCIKRSPLGQRNCNLLKVAQFIWNILWQITKMWLLNTGDRSIEVTAWTGLVISNLHKIVVTFFFCGYTLTSNDPLHGVTSGFIYSISVSARSLPFKQEFWLCWWSTFQLHTQSPKYCKYYL
jgi:hypothetical protein